jgi:sulfite reductase (NADPH) flavoprotein alpha-component
VQPIKIIYGTETDTAMGLAEELSDALQAAGLSSQALDMQDVDVPALAEDGIVLVVTSTYGNGDPPFNARALLESLRTAEGAALAKTKFAVFGLGDSTYPKFCQCGRDFDAQFELLGAQRILPRVDADGDPCDLFEAWQKEIVGVLAN